MFLLASARGRCVPLDLVCDAVTAMQGCVRGQEMRSARLPAQGNRLEWRPSRQQTAPRPTSVSNHSQALKCCAVSSPAPTFEVLFRTEARRNEGRLALPLAQAVAPHCVPLGFCGPLLQGGVLHTRPTAPASLLGTDSDCT